MIEKSLDPTRKQLVARIWAAVFEQETRVPLERWRELKLPIDNGGPETAAARLRQFGREFGEASAAGLARLEERIMELAGLEGGKRHRRRGATAADKPLATGTSIMQWLAALTVPSRHGAAVILENYVNRFMSDIPGLQTDVKHLKAVLHPDATPLPPGPSYIATEAVVAPRHRAESSPEPDYLLGHYQILRPYINNVKFKKYVLEPLAIENVGNKLKLLMYSHNKIVEGYHYSGDLVVEKRSISATITRKHSQPGREHSVRCVMMLSDIDGKRHELLKEAMRRQGRVDMCFSGAITRLTDGEHYRRAMVAVAAIAIKIHDDKKPFLEMPFEEGFVGPDGLQRVGGMLCGEVTPASEPIYRFCDDLFKALRQQVADDSLGGLAIGCASFDDVRRQVVSASGGLSVSGASGLLALNGQE